MDCDIPDALVAQVRDGRAVLLFGAGASLAARDSSGATPPTGRALGELIADKFLGGKYRNFPLTQIAEYAINEFCLNDVQLFIRSVFEPFCPSTAHSRVTSFPWWGLATTNYDRLLEIAYEQTPSAVQSIRPIISNEDRIEDYLRDQKNVLLLKLHGCISRATDSRCPFVLTTEQYIDHAEGRDRLFKTLQEWATERTIIYIGHSLQDPDIRAMLKRLSTHLDNRPRHYLITKELDDIQSRFWEARKVTPIAGGFDLFMETLDRKLDSPFRGLPGLVSPLDRHSSQAVRMIQAAVSEACKQFLELDVDIVGDITSTDLLSSKDFYRGVDPGFSAIEQRLDVPRGLADSILSDHVLDSSRPGAERPELVVIKAHAGAGKTVLMKRIAWDAAHDYEKLCLFATQHGHLGTAAIQELLNQVQGRVFLFLDNVADRVREIYNVIKSLGPEGSRLTIIAAERVNEWNISCATLSEFVTESYELNYLNSREIQALLALLTKHRALGRLENVPVEERMSHLSERAGRQLLVALHEATVGKPFEDIIQDEYENILPEEARRLYLSICVLNRLDVPVRAGLISRMHGIGFEEFKNRLFAPLEHIIRVDVDPTCRDHVYKARHPHIADMVFQRALRNVEERFDHYVRSVRALNLEYSSDRSAYRRMIRGRVINDLFPSPEYGYALYSAALEHEGDRAYVYHQRAIFEMQRYGGSLEAAGADLARAQSLEPWNMSIKHSIAEHNLRSSERARTPLERSRFLGEAERLARQVKFEKSEESYGVHTLVKAGTVRVKELLDCDESPGSDVALERALKVVEAHLSEGILKFPGDPFLLSAEAQLAEVLKDSDRALGALEKAFVANPRNSYIAVRLAKTYISRHDVDKAEETLKRALNANERDQNLHYQYSKLLLTRRPGDQDDLLYHLQRSFAPGDSNYDAQLLYGRQLFVGGDRDASRKVFSDLKRARASEEVREKLVYPLPESSPGQITKLETSYAFVARDGTGDWIYAAKRAFQPEHFKALTRGVRVSMKIGFSMKGPGAIWVAPDRAPTAIPEEMFEHSPSADRD